MNNNRMAQLCNDILDWVSEMYDGFELYEWSRNRGMSEKEIDQTFGCFDEVEMAEYREKYDEIYK